MDLDRRAEKRGSRGGLLAFCHGNVRFSQQLPLGISVVCWPGGGPPVTAPPQVPVSRRRFSIGASGRQSVPQSQSVSGNEMLKL